MIFWMKKGKKVFQKLPVYNVLIEVATIKHLSKINFTSYHKLPFYDELRVAEITKSFKGYASYKIEITNLKDPLAQ